MRLEKYTLGRGCWYFASCRDSAISVKRLQRRSRNISANKSTGGHLVFPIGPKNTNFELTQVFVRLMSLSCCAVALIVFTKLPKGPHIVHLSKMCHLSWLVGKGSYYGRKMRVPNSDRSVHPCQCVCVCASVRLERNGSVNFTVRKCNTLTKYTNCTFWYDVQMPRGGLCLWPTFHAWVTIFRNKLLQLTWTIIYHVRRRPYFFLTNFYLKHGIS